MEQTLETMELELGPVVEQFLKRKYPDWTLAEILPNGKAKCVRNVTQPVHHGTKCEAFGMSPIQGRRYCKTASNDSGSLCEEEFLKLSNEERNGYVCIPRPGDIAVHEHSLMPQAPSLTSQAVARDLPEPVMDLVLAALSHASDNLESLKRALSEVPAEQFDSMAFLIACMPPRDLVTLSSEFLLESVRVAYEAKSSMAWGSKIPDKLFYECVVPYVQASEARDPWRAMLLDQFGPQVQQVDSVEAAVGLLNREVFSLLGVSYHATKRPKPDQSPKESIEAQYASCTGLSILLADACRAVCIPARLASVPLWSDRDVSQAGGPHTWAGSGNHTWVEVWDPQVNAWRYIGASEQGPLDNTWFTGKCAKVDGSHVMTRIYGLSFRPTGVLFPCVWLRDNDYIYGEDITARYTEGITACDTTTPWWESFARAHNL